MDLVRKQNPPQPFDYLDPGEKLFKQLCAIITNVLFLAGKWRSIAFAALIL